MVEEEPPPLPVPAGGRVTAIVHLADLHIRTGDPGRARYAEYGAVFAELLGSLAALPQVRDGTAIVVIAGDVFDAKGRVEASGIDLFVRLVRALASGMGLPTFAIRGNHDYRQHAVEPEPDLLGSLAPALSDATDGRFRYLDASGVYELADGRTTLGVLAIEDLLQHGATSGPATGVERRRLPVVAGDGGGVVVGIAHATVRAIDELLPTAPSGRYDAVLLGDLHLQGVHGCHDSRDDDGWSVWRDDAVAWGYPGSLVQQTFGETALAGHGYLLWDLERRRVRAVDVPSTHAMLVLSLRVDGPFRIANAGAAIIGTDDAVRHLSVRVRSRTTDALDAARRFLAERFPAATVHQLTLDGAAVQEDDEASSSPATMAAVGALNALNAPDAWIEDLCGAGIEREAARRIVERPEDALLLPDCGGLAALRTLAPARNERVAKRVVAYRDVRAQQSTIATARRRFRIVELSWSWLLCYGADNVVRFPSGGVTVVAGANGHGKSSLFEIVHLALYGEGVPSRSTRASAPVDVINRRKPDDATARACITLELDGDQVVRIERAFVVKAGKLAAATAKDTFVVDVGAQKKLATKGPAVDAYVRATVGSSDAFLTSAMVTQSSDRDFFALSAAEQRALLDAAIGMQTHCRFVDAVKEARLAHAAAREALCATLATLTHLDDVHDGEKGESSSSSDDKDDDDASPSSSAAAADVDAARRELAKRRQELMDVQRRLMDVRRRLAGLMTAAQDGDDVSEGAGDVEAAEESVRLLGVARATAEASAAAAVATRNATLREIKDLTSSTQQQPFNPECAACRAQPWRVRLDELERRIDEDPTRLERLAAEATAAKEAEAAALHRLRRCLEARERHAAEQHDAAEADVAARAAAVAAATAAVAVRAREAAARRAQRDAARCAQVRRDVGDAMKDVEAREQLLARVGAALEASKARAYSDRVVPMLVGAVNVLLRSLPMGSPQVALHANAEVGAFELSVDGIAVPLDKASGFQRFVVSLAMRIALGRVGASGVTSRQLFLDEGFVACDAHNLACVPDFLRRLVTSGVHDAGIVLVSHLETLQECADRTVRIARCGRDSCVRSEAHR